MVENEPWNALLCQKWSHWPFSHKRRILRLRRIIHLQNPSKLTEKQMDEVRRIVHPKLRPFHFQIKTYYLSDVNYTTDNPSLVWIRPLWAFWSSSMTGYKNDLMESKKSTGTTRKADLNLVRNLLSLSWPSSFLASQHGVFVSATFLTGARVAWQLVSAWPSVHEVPSSIPGDIASLFQLLSFLCSFDYNVALDTLKRGEGVKWVQCRPQIYQLFLSRVIEVKYYCFTFLPFSVVSPCSYAVFQWRHKISVLVFWAFFCCIFIKRKMKLLKGSVHTYPNIFETIFFSV